MEGRTLAGGCFRLERLHGVRHDLLSAAEDLSDRNYGVVSSPIAIFGSETVGILLYLVPTYIAGVTQGFMWRDFTPEGYPAYLNIIELVNASKPMWWISIAGSLLYFTGIILLAINYVKTWSARPGKYQVPVIQVAPLSKNDNVKSGVSNSQIDGVLNIGHKIDVWQQAKWHREWEQSPIRFVVLTIGAISLAAIFQLMPMFFN